MIVPAAEDGFRSRLRVLLVRRLAQVGIRTLSPHQRDQAARFGVEIIDMKSWTGDLEIEMNASSKRLLRSIHHDRSDALERFDT